MNSTKRKIGTLIAGLALAVTAGGVTAALAAGTSTPSVAPASVSINRSVNDDGTADQGHGDVPAEKGEDHGGNRGPGNTNEDHSGSGHGEDDNSGHDANDDNSGHGGEGPQHG